MISSDTSPMNYPKPDACREMLIKAGCEKRVIEHIETVHRFAMAIGEKLISRGVDINMPLLEAGVLLHDIGRSITHDIRHAIEGARIARKMGVPDDVVGIIENHIGAGLTKEDAAGCGLPIRDYLPKTIEQKIAAHADNLTAGDKFSHLEGELFRLEKKGLHSAAVRMKKLHEELSELCGVDLDELLKDI